jgi:uncharacterized protein (TIGR03435 family)
MTPDSRDVDKALHQHLGLFGAPSANQLDASRSRIRERLRAARGPAATDTAPDVQSAFAKASTFALRATADKPAGPGWRTVHPTWRLGLSLAAAAVVAVVVLVPWQHTDWIATVEAADGSRYSLAPNTPVRTGHAGPTLLTLTDGTRLEMRALSELSIERATDGIGIRLRRGGLIVNAGQPHRDRLYVHTKDMTVSNLGTLFAVNTEDLGSRVTAIEGDLLVRDGAGETTLRPGHERSSSPALATRPVKEIIGWSRAADAILAAFTRGMRETGAPLESLLAGSGAFTAADGQAAVTGQAAAPEFDVASIKPCDPDHLPQAPENARGGGANSLQMTPSRLRALCVTVATLIRTAYNMRPAGGPFDVDANTGRGMSLGTVYGLGQEDGLRVRGGPDWIRSERYTVEAVINDRVVNDPAMLGGSMLKQLLESRLHIKVHADSEQLPAYALTVAKSGLKMKPVQSGACEPLQGREGSALFFGYPASVLTPPHMLDNLQRGDKPSCGMWGHLHGPNAVIIAGDMPLEAVLTSLGLRLGVRVLDRTGVKDRFNFVLEFVLDDNTPGVPGVYVRTTPEPSDIPPAATIFTALEEQLGLRLEPAKAPREYLVIDHVERPSAN